MLTISTPFWRDEPLSENEKELLGLLFAAHDKAVFRQNPSSAAVVNSGFGSGDYAKAIASALLTFGGVHAPIAETIALISDDNPVALVKSVLKSGGKVPGWGSSFSKGQMDPDWAEVDSFLDVHFRNLYDRLYSITKALHEKGKHIWPNPSAYTACAAIVLKLPTAYAPYLLVAARLDSWSKLLLRGA